jgi:Rrf2 family protein
MIEIAKSSREGVFQKDIAKNQNISVKYLDHIIAPLKVAGLITNVNGRKSGYMLTTKPEDITVLDIHKAFEGGVCIVDCLERISQCERRDKCTVQYFWMGLNNNIIEYLQKVSLKDLLTGNISV